MDELMMRLARVILELEAMAFGDDVASTAKLGALKILLDDLRKQEMHRHKVEEDKGSSERIMVNYGNYIEYVTDGGKKVRYVQEEPAELDEEGGY